jgi:hypothetical protein
MSFLDTLNERKWEAGCLVVDMTLPLTLLYGHWSDTRRVFTSRALINGWVRPLAGSDQWPGLANSCLGLTNGHYRMSWALGGEIL